uniref:mannose-6-phosphate isomerase n=1 Tax=Aceria tosichella TaxID=561515 RepID=A0A6G1S7T5_9ACAR
MIPVKGHVKNYHWGKVGDDNHIAKFLAVAQSQTSISRNNSQDKQQKKGDETAQQHLAELWFGSHPSGPSMVCVGNNLVGLDKFLAKEPEMIGVVDQYFKYNKQLPFLFKILSIAQSLSLQAHPDKELAKILHKRDPQNYPDSNHKPELAIALTDFHVLCDFRPHTEISRFIKDIEPLRQVIGSNASDNYVNLVENRIQDNTSLRRGLGDCFKSLMVQAKSVILRETKNLLTNHPKTIGQDVLKLIGELHSLYPGDPGVFAPFFLNYFKLSPGQAIYLKPNKLHAYLKGECLECMACSDNVVRAGLTTKFRDTTTLLEMLDYEPVKSYLDLVITPTKKQSNGYAIDLFSPIDEFKVAKIVISNKHEYLLPSVNSGSFVIVLNGKGSAQDFFDTKLRHKLSFGFAAYVPPKISINITDIQESLVMYRAFC